MGLISMGMGKHEDRERRGADRTPGTAQLTGVGWRGQRGTQEAD